MQATAEVRMEWDSTQRPSRPTHELNCSLVLNYEPELPKCSVTLTGQDL
jgi:hypothetical protein